MSETRLNRRRQADTDLTLESPAADPVPGGAAFLCKTTTVSSYPTVAQRFYGVLRVSPGGTESEGSTPSLPTAGTVFYAANVGSAIPPTGTSVLVSLAGPRWVFQYNG